MSIKPFKDQDYNELKEQYDSSNLFEDPEFPIGNQAIYHTQQFGKQMSRYRIQWKRPNQVCRNPQFVVNGFNRCDMDQGAVGNCWFIAGCVGIMQSDKLFAKVVPHEQNFTNNYTGMFHFRFYQYGEWVDVVVDDRLPFSDNRLVFSSNKDEPNEFWAPLLEKAFAKLNGNYEALESGLTADAIIDMSGGLREEFDLKNLDPNIRANFWTILYQAYRKQSIMGCSITADSNVREARQSNGLVRGHAYTITKLAVITSQGRNVRLLRIRNPWGNEVEWKGSWADSSREWNSVSDEEKEEIGLNFDRDGEFWMSYEDFLINWTSLEICHLSVDSFSDEIGDQGDLSWKNLFSDSENSWKSTIYHGEWITGQTAGGCGNGNQAKFWTNPQFLVTLNDVDENDDENMTTCVIALMQKDSRLKRIEQNSDSAEESIQFRFYRIKDSVELNETKNTNLRLYSNQLTRVGQSGSYINSREVTKRFRVEPVPSTYEEDRDCRFMLRIFTEQSIETNSLNEHKDNLNEDESFFEQLDSDEIFSSWANLLGEQPANEELNEQEFNAANRPTPKEKCILM